MTAPPVGRCVDGVEHLRALHRRPDHESEKDAKLAQRLGQLQPFIAILPQECMGQLASFGPI
jgi:hypothetical protein